MEVTDIRAQKGQYRITLTVPGYHDGAACKELVAKYGGKGWEYIGHSWRRADLNS